MDFKTSAVAKMSDDELVIAYDAADTRYSAEGISEAEERRLENFMLRIECEQDAREVARIEEWSSPAS
jgi:hypothetical protein